MPDQIDILGGKLGDIGFPGARVGTKIFRRRKLGRVDEDRDHDLCRPAFGEANQRYMTVMERTHGRHQCYGGFSGAKTTECATQRGDGTGDHGVS